MKFRGERIAIGGLAAFALLSLFISPWAALSREIGAKSAVLVLPNNILDFTGRTESIILPNAVTILALSCVLLAVMALAGFVRQKGLRSVLWLLSGIALLVLTFWGLQGFQQSVATARSTALGVVAQAAIEKPRKNTDVEAVQVAFDALGTIPIAESAEALKAAGVRVRRLPYDNSGFALASFLAIITSILAIFFSLRLFKVTSSLIDSIIQRAAVPATSIILAFAAAGIVVLALQPTPVGTNVEISGFFPYIAGRLDTLWYAYLTLLSYSLGTVGGFLEALKFATPLIFTGLAVALSFRSGLFNIGAPGQMVLGAIFAMFVGIYLPGPKFFVLPIAVIAAALGGALWGGLAGWLKARFGANEVINTILLNYIAASLLLFLISSQHNFASAAFRALIAFAVLIAVAMLLSLIPAMRRLFTAAPRRNMAILGLVFLTVFLVSAWPRSTDGTITVNLPFKTSGSESKSIPLSESARFDHLPKVLGIDLSENPGTNIIPVNYGIVFAPLIALLVFLFFPFRRMGNLIRIVISLGVGAIVYLALFFFGLTAFATAIPPTTLNFSFILAILAAIFVYYFLWRTKWGYELRAVGLSPLAAEYAGAKLSRNMILAMALSGGLAGLTACHYVLGGTLGDYSLRISLPTNDGFDGIAVALLGYNTPLGVVLAAFLFGVLKNGGSVLNITFPELTRDVVDMVVALVVLFIAAKGFLPERITNPKLRAASLEDDLKDDLKNNIVEDKAQTKDEEQR